MQNGAKNIRVDIQVLRGLAVAAVVLYHAKLAGLGAGYLGVDIFFVLSGFLITRLIKESVEQGTFTYRLFLLRRAKRLLPAALTTFLVTALISPVFLASQEMADFRMQLVGALTFSANIVLNNQSGYFHGSAELKPLLHIWSLSIEEQYYFLLPAIFLLLPQRAWLAVLVSIGVASLGYCLLNLSDKSTFWLLQTRAWELLIGSMGVFFLNSAWKQKISEKLFWFAILTLLLCLFFEAGTHPGPQALIVCLATLAIILAEHPIEKYGRPVQVLRKLGDISYSLYLVHWPIFAFYNNVYLGDENTLEAYLSRFGLVGLSLALAFALNRYIEEPFRNYVINPQSRAAVLCSLAGALSVALGVWVTQADSLDDNYIFQRRANVGLSPKCESTHNVVPIADCQNSRAPAALVWGDSFAMHLVAGVANSGPPIGSLVQATRSRCGPLLGISSLEYSEGGQKWTRDCIAFNDQVLAYLKATPEIRTVILSSPLGNYTRGITVLERDSKTGVYTLSKGNPSIALAAFKRTVETIRALGRDVMLVAPPPSSGFDIGRCLERRERGLFFAGVDEQCRIATADYKQNRASILDLLNRLESEMVLPVVRFDSILCNEEFCRTELDNVALYRDEAHLSYTGSVLLLQHPGVKSQIKIALVDGQNARLASRTD